METLEKIFWKVWLVANILHPYVPPTKEQKTNTGLKWHEGKLWQYIFGVNFPVSKLDYGISLQALEIAAWNIFKKPLPKYEIIVFVSYFYFVLGGGGSLWRRKCGKDASIARTQYWTLLIKCFHRMGKHETRNCDQCGQILTLEHVL